MERQTLFLPQTQALNLTWTRFETATCWANPVAVMQMRNSGKIMVSQTLSTYIKLNSSCKCLHQHVSSAHTSQADIVINSPTHLRCYFWINFIIIYTYFTFFRYVSLYFLVSFRLMFFSINKHCQYELL